MELSITASISKNFENVLLLCRNQTVKVVEWIIVVVAAPFIANALMTDISRFGKWNFITGLLTPFFVSLFLIFVKDNDKRDWQAKVLVFVIYGAGVTELLRHGLLGVGKEYMLMLPVLAAVLMGIRAGIGVTFINLVSILAISYLAHASLLHGVMNPEAELVPVSNWDKSMLVYAIINICMLFVLFVFYRKQKGVLSDELISTHSLQQINDQLLNEIAYRQTADLRAQYQVQRLNALREVDRAISANFDIKTVLRVVCQQIVIHLEADAAEICLINKRGMLESMAFEGMDVALPSREKISVNPRLVKLAMRKHRNVEISDLLQCTGIDEAFFANGQKIHSYFAIPVIIEQKSCGVLEVFHRFSIDSSQEWVSFLEMLVGQVIIAVEHNILLDSLERSNQELSRAYDTTLEGWANTLEMRDQETRGHSQRVTSLTLALAKKLCVPEDLMPHIRRGALLHDVGKMAIPDSTLLKPGKLDEDEWRIMKMHPIYAYNLLQSIDFLQPALSIPRYHHEKWDGTGYPDGLKGEDIPFEARIFAVVDVWDALLVERPYKRSWSKPEALEYIHQQAGHHFDPRVVAAFEEIIKPELNN